MLDIMPSNIPTKKEFNETIQYIKNRILENEIESVKALALIKYLNIFSESLLKDELLKKKFLNEVEKQGKDFEMHGLKFQVKSQSKGSATWDFTVCNDSVWENLRNEEETIKKKRVERETFLKTIKSDNPVYNEEGIQLEAPINNSELGLTISMLK